MACTRADTGSSGRGPGSRARAGRPFLGPLMALVLVSCLVAPRPARAQLDRIGAGAGGAAAGAIVGVYTTTAIYVTKARFGSYIYSLGDLIQLRVETLPIVAAPVAGAVLGASSPADLGRAALWGGLGFAAGAGLGYLGGHVIGDSDEARWAGGIIGSAIGVWAGALFGALRDGDEQLQEPMTLLRVMVPLGRSGGGS